MNNKIQNNFSLYYKNIILVHFSFKFIIHIVYHHKATQYFFFFNTTYSKEF